MTRRARIRAFLLGLLIGGGSWTAAAHDDTVVPDAPCDGVVADCAGDGASQVDQLDASRPTVGDTGPSVPAKSALSIPAVAQHLTLPSPAPTSRQAEVQAFARGILATVGKQMSGTPPLGLLSGSSWT